MRKILMLCVILAGSFSPPCSAQSCQSKALAIGAAFVQPLELKSSLLGRPIPFASAPAFGMRGLVAEPTGSAIPFGTEVTISGFVIDARSGGRLALSTMKGGASTYIRVLDLNANAAWRCGILDAVDGDGSTLRRYSYLPALMASKGLRAIDVNSREQVEMDPVTADVRLVCRRSFNGRQPVAGEVDCYIGKRRFKLSAADVRVPSPEEVAASLPGAFTDTACRRLIKNPDGTLRKGLTAYLLPRLSWPSGRSNPSYFEMVTTYERTGPVAFAQNGLLPYGTAVTIEEALPAYGMSRGLLRVKAEGEGSEYLVDPADVIGFKFWECDIKGLLADFAVGNVYPIIAQLPIRISDVNAVGVDSYSNQSISPKELSSVKMVTCDNYATFNDERGSKALRCQGVRHSFTVDSSTVKIVTPEELRQ